jgi:hypothetical protein
MRTALLGASLAFSALSAISHPAHAAEPSIQECLTASNTSVKLRTAHKLGLARSQLLVCVAASCPAEVRAECSLRMDQVTASIPTVVFDVKDAAGHDLAAVKVTMDGQVVATKVDGTALTFDPGSHEISFEADGQTATSTIVLREGEKNRHVAVVIGQPAAAAAPVAAPEPAAPAQAVAPATAEDRGHDRRVLGLAAGGAGVVGVVVGAIFGGLTLSSWSSAKSACPTFTNCTADATNDRSRALTESTVSDIGIIAGGVLVATGAVLYFTAPKRDAAPAARLRLGPGRFAVEGSF